MTDASDQTHFAVTYSEDELTSIGRLIAARRARAENDNTLFGLVFAVPLVIGFAVYGAFTLGLIARDAVPAALAAAFVAFPAGWVTYWWLLRRHYRTRAALRRIAMQLGPWNYAFGEDGVSYTSDNILVQLKWRVIDTVDDLGRIVLLRFGDQNIFIPGRMFADNAARKAFAAACAARIEAAAEPSK